MALLSPNNEPMRADATTSPKGREYRGFLRDTLLRTEEEEGLLTRVRLQGKTNPRKCFGLQTKIRTDKEKEQTNGTSNNVDKSQKHVRAK